MKISSVQDKTNFRASIKWQGNVKLKDVTPVEKIVARLAKKDQYLVDITDNKRIVGDPPGHGSYSVIDIVIASVRKGKLEVETIDPRFDVNDYPAPKDVTPTLISHFEDLLDEEILAKAKKRMKIN